MTGNAPAPPWVEHLQGQQVALVGYVVQLPGQGTTPPSGAVEVDAVNASAHRLWRIVAPLPGQPADLVGDPTVEFVGASGDDAVAVVGDGEDNYRTVAFDITHRKVAWQSGSFLAGTVVGETVVGTLDTTTQSGLGSHAQSDALHVSALSLQTGKVDWEQAQQVSAANVQQAAPDSALMEATDFGSGDDVISLLHADNGKGKVLARQQASSGGQGSPWDCQFDGRLTVVCGDTEGTQGVAAFAVDGSTGNVLWQLPDKKANRIAPNITAVYRGKVYGTTSNGPLVLDARTGRDVNDSPGVAPLLVDQDVGIADSVSDGLKAYLARD